MSLLTRARIRGPPEPETREPLDSELRQSARSLSLVRRDGVVATASVHVRSRLNEQRHTSSRHRSLPVPLVSSFLRPRWRTTGRASAKSQPTPLQYRLAKRRASSVVRTARRLFHLHPLLSIESIGSASRSELRIAPEQSRGTKRIRFGDPIELPNRNIPHIGQVAEAGRRISTIFNKFGIPS